MSGKYWLIGLVALAVSFGVRAEDPVSKTADGPMPPPPGEAETPPPANRKPPRHNGVGPAMWRAFSRLTEAQRQELMKLQNTDPEQFRAKMRALGEALRKEEHTRFEELMKLVERCRVSKDEKEKAALKTEIIARIRKHYLERLEDNKRQLEEMKRRTERLEKELAKRQKNADAIVKARAEALIRGELPPPPKPRKPGPPENNGNNPEPAP